MSLCQSAVTNDKSDEKGRERESKGAEEKGQENEVCQSAIEAWEAG